ncbi:MFS transporter [Sutcliffiella horikoshii]|uniref:MFS transporter n=1 Tax=Sutcliffiella horikoshii TaxID=79883 RepID=A0A5D4SU57_9BACI|nr:MFS transporter [Sutcliffiella horikoshii]TYS65778.1 MFS transporter [Sutcliffiella horikoshii]
MGYKELLKINSYRNLFVGQVLSDIGNWLTYIIIISIFTYQWNLPPSKLALLTIFISIPWIVLSPFSGIFSDMFDRKKIMVVCDFLRALLVILPIFFQSYWAILLIITLIHSTAVFFEPSKQSAIKELVPEQGLIKANSLSQLSSELSKIVAPSIGGLVLFFGNTSIAFILNFICFLLSASLLLKLPHLKIQEQPKKEVKVNIHGLLSGFKFIVSRSKLLLSVISMFFITFFIFIIDSFIALWSKGVGIPSSLFPLLISAIGVGSLIGAIVVGKFGERISPIKLNLFSILVVGLLFSIIGLSGELFELHFVFWLCIWSIIALVGSAVPISFAVVLQTQTPSHLMGRVYSASESITNIPMFIAPLLGAWLINLIGIGYVFLSVGFFFVLFTTIGLFFVQNRGAHDKQTELDVV